MKIGKSNFPESENIWLTDFCDSIRIFVSVIMIQLVVLIYALSFLSFDFDFLRKLSILALMAQLVGLNLLIIMCKLKRYFNNMNVIKGTLTLILLVIAITTILAQVVGYLNNQLFFLLLPSDISINILNLKLSVSSVLICLALVRYFYIQDQWSNHVQKLSEARLNALQARIKPHFLFNSLNSIASLIAINPQRAESAITDFSGLMRRAFTHKKNNISIADELDWVSAYLAIEKLRLADRLSFSINCEEQLKSIKIPVLCLQPLVENAVIHGIQPLENGGSIKIEIYTLNTNLIIKVCNPFELTINKNSNGTALRNIKQRLALQYGNKAYMQIMQEKGTFIIELGIPL